MMDYNNEWRVGKTVIVNYNITIKGEKVNRFLKEAIIIEVNSSHFVFIDTIKNKRVEVHKDDVRNIQYVKGGGEE